jgi:integrase
VTLPGFLAPVLTDHLTQFVGAESRSLVFGTVSGRPLARSNWTATFLRARTAVGTNQPEVLTIHFHDLRHAAATAAVQNGATLKDTMARLGHASPRAALIYQHTARDRDEAIAHALNQVAPALEVQPAAASRSPRAHSRPRTTPTLDRDR